MCGEKDTKEEEEDEGGVFTGRKVLLMTVWSSSLEANRSLRHVSWNVK